MSGETIQVCEGWWRQRCENVVRIVGSSGCPDYPWKCAYGTWYRDDGRWSKEFQQHPLDIIRFLGKNITITAADWVRQ
jgi:hypothetical protein